MASFPCNILNFTFVHCRVILGHICQHQRTLYQCSCVTNPGMRNWYIFQHSVIFVPFENWCRMSLSFTFKCNVWHLSNIVCVIKGWQENWLIYKNSWRDLKSKTSQNMKFFMNISRIFVEVRGSFTTFILHFSILIPIYFFLWQKEQLFTICYSRALFPKEFVSEFNQTNSFLILLHIFHSDLV